MAKTRREFLQESLQAVGIATLLASCSKSPKDMQLVDLAQILDNPKNYVGQELKTEGFLEYVGSEMKHYPIQMHGTEAHPVFLSGKIDQYKLHKEENKESPYIMVSTDGLGIFEGEAPKGITKATIAGSVYEHKGEIGIKYRNLVQSEKP
jgi:hypothetical protein